MDYAIGYGICGHAGASLYHEFDTVDQLKQAIVLEWHALPRRFTDHSIG